MKTSALCLLILIGVAQAGNASAATCTEPTGGRDEIIARIVSNSTRRVFRPTEAFRTEIIQMSTDQKYSTTVMPGNLIDQLQFCDRFHGFVISLDEAKNLSGKTKPVAAQCGDAQDLEVYVAFNSNYCAFELDIGGGHYLVNDIDAAGNLHLDDFMRSVRYTFQPQI